MKRRRRQRLPQEPIQLDIQGLNHQGRGIGKISGKTVFVSNALPGEKVSARYRASFSQYDDAEGLDVIDTPSSDRTAPVCAHYELCGGCGLQHLAVEKQREHKANTLFELIERATGTKPITTLAPLTSETLGYRRKARLSVKNVPGKGDVLVGFRERFSSFVAVVDECKVLHPAVGTKIQALREMLSKFTHKSDIPQLEIAVADDKTVIIVRHMLPLSDAELELLRSFSKQHQIDILLQSKGIKSIKSLNNDSTDLRIHYHLPDYDLQMAFYPWQFTQINSEINQKMLAQAIALLELQPTDRVLDLFCGIGNFSLPIAKSVKQVVGIEGEAQAIDMAAYNAKQNGLDNTEFHCFDLREDPSEQAWAQQTYDKILLDPARSGAKEIMPWIQRWQPSRLVYVSCNPSTLARDCQLLIEQGYTMQAGGMMDMFPHTEHTEAMVLFQKA